MNNFTIDIDSDGVALVTFDVPGRSMNTLTNEVIGEIEPGDDVVIRGGERLRDGQSVTMSSTTPEPSV